MTESEADRLRKRVLELSKEVAHSDDVDLEREIALGDRSAAVDGLVRSVSWLIGTALLLNGGALLAVIDQKGIPPTVAIIGPFIFLFGLFSAILAAGLAAHYAVRLMDRANVKLKRLPEEKMVPTLRWQVVLTTLIGSALLSSYLFFGIGATNSLKIAAEARIDALKAPPAKAQRLSRETTTKKAGPSGSAR